MRFTLENQIESEIDIIDKEEFENDDFMLSFKWTVGPELLKDLGLQDDRYGVMRSLVAELIVASEVDRAIAYSRGRSFYKDKQRYHGRGYTYARILKAVDEISNAHYVVSWIAPARPPKQGRKGKQSTIYALPKFKDACKGYEVTSIQHECIWQRDDDGKWINYTETGEIKQMRWDLQSINNVIGEIQYDVAMEGVRKTKYHIIIPHKSKRNNKLVELAVPHGRPCLRRVFCRSSFERGGRLYGSWQNLPKKVRECLLINGEPTAEPDFTSLHPKIAYAYVGEFFDQDYDIYQDRGLIEKSKYKLALLIAMNARSPEGAIHALKKKLKIPLNLAIDIYDQVIEKNPQIKRFIAADKGVEFQKVDSELALYVIKACQRHGIPCLPIHDSFLVPVRFEAKTKEFMTEAWMDFIQKERSRYIGKRHKFS